MIISYNEENISIEHDNGLLEARIIDLDYIEMYFEIDISNYDISLESIYNIFDNNTIIIDHIYVDKKNRGQGIGSKLIAKLLELYKDYRIILNASPIGQDKISINDLKLFYSSLNFKILIDQGTNIIMYR